jgi:DTW domain-containing protein YfiP
VKNNPAVKPEEVEIEICENCEKAPPLCFCSEIKKLANEHHVLILQHPQEPDKELGTARLAHLALGESTLKIGLSWRNLSAALGREVQNSRWAVLYLGSGAKGEQKLKPGLTFVAKNGHPLSDEESGKIKNELEGIVILDGTWSQAKALWWRNAWLLKLKRVILVPSQKSLYGPLRKEPRRECVSTIECIADSLVNLGEGEKVGTGLRHVLTELLSRYKTSKQKPPRLSDTSAN